MSSIGFDDNKSLSFKGKHGIDFLDAQKLWDYVNRLIVQAKNLDETRF